MRRLKIAFILAVLLFTIVYKAEAQEAFSFVQMCDPQFGMGGYGHDVEEFQLAVDQINELNPDFVVICGDLVHDANDSTYSDFLRIRSGFTMPSYLAPGNHDVGNVPNDTTLAFYRNTVGADYYDFSHNGYAFVVANTQLWKADVEGESDKHDRWFKKTLADKSKSELPLFVIGHIPLYLEDSEEEESYSNFPIGKRNEILGLFEQYEVLAYLTGHTHRTIIHQHKSTQLVSGETSSKNFDKRPMGFRIWEVSPDTIKHHFEAIQPVIEENLLIDTTLNEIQNLFMNNQAEELLGHANQVLATHLPDWPEPPARKSAMLLLDGVLHDVYAPHRPPVQTFLKDRLKMAAEEIEQTQVAEGARIWKLYNHGFIVRTRSVTFAFDLVSGKSIGIDGFRIEDDVMQRLVNQCDVLFISHYHSDHAEEKVAQAFIDQGKPVVAPPAVWKDRAIYAQISHLEREPHALQKLLLQDGQKELQVVVYPGHQGANIENNVSLVISPEGLSFAQMGDQSNDNDFVWIDEVGDRHQVDVLMPNCWTTDIVRVAQGFNPALIITGHENEMGHTIDHREPNWLTYQRKEGSDRFGGSRDVGYSQPLILMTWGESYHYNRDTFN
jgi:L-ascorbate metabolism protein UlaG (beta-lactamase superfamily)